MSATVDVLIPTYRRPAALAVTLAGVAAQTMRDFRVIVSDQTEPGDPAGAAEDSREVRAVAGVLRMQGRTVELHRHLPRRGLAEHRQFLLDQVTAPYALFLDDDLVLEPDLLGRMLTALRLSGAGFVGSAVIGWSFTDDVRPHEQAVEFWDGPVTPETVRPGTPAWERWRLHNAANIHHIALKHRVTRENSRLYKVAWTGGCVMYDAAKLRAVGGFGFWTDLPSEHCGEDVLAQQRVMARFGGAGLLPSGAYHQELPTTVTDRRVDAPKVLA
jgi:GT2 family glycosyltransferase